LSSILVQRLNLNYFLKVFYKRFFIVRPATKNSFAVYFLLFDLNQKTYS